MLSFVLKPQNREAIIIKADSNRISELLDCQELSLLHLEPDSVVACLKQLTLVTLPKFIREV